MAVVQSSGNEVPQAVSSDYYDTRVRTAEAAETLEWLRAQYGRVDMQVEVGSFAERAVGDDAFSLRHLSWRCRAEVEYGVDRFFFATGTPGFSWRIGSASGEYSIEPAVAQPGQEYSGVADGAEIDIVAFDAARLEDAVRTIYGDDALEVRFDGTGPVSRRMRDYWVATLRWAFTQLPLLAEPLVRAHVHRALVSATLEAFPLAGDPRERRASAMAQAATYSAAMRWMDDHASLPITADDAARATGTSVAGLRRAFAANGQLSSTPEGYLEHARVSAAHADLMASDPTRTTVAEIALRWGFVDLPGFAAAYRAAYRADPKTTLDR